MGAWHCLKDQNMSKTFMVIFRLMLDIDTFMSLLRTSEKSLIAQLMLDLLEFNFCLKEVESRLDTNDRYTSCIYFRILVFNLILAIMDEYGFEIIQNFSEVLSLIKSIILSEDSEVVPLGLTLLAAILGNGKLSKLMIRCDGAINRKHG